MTMTPRDLMGLLEELGLTRLRVRMDEIWASCPSCSDSGNSWSINQKTGKHSCFACGLRGGLDGLIMEVRDCSRFDADKLIYKFGVVIADPEELLAQKVEGNIRVEPRPWVPEVLIRQFSDVPDYWLEQRQLTRTGADAFGIKWNGERLAWVLPIRTPGGVLLGWQEKSKEGVWNRPPHMKKSVTVFGAQLLVSCDFLVIVESPLDAARLHQLGYPAVATFGATVSEEQMRMSIEYADSIILALDNDPAGTANMLRLATGKGQGKETNTRWASRVPMGIINYPEGVKDVGDMDDDEISDALTTAIHVLDWLPLARKKISVPREASAFPRAGRGLNGGKAKSPGRLQYGAGKGTRRRHSGPP